MANDIGPSELASRLAAGEALTRVDVRQPGEFNRSHIAGAINVPLGSIRGPIEGVPTSAALVVMCQHGMRSAAACKQLRNSYPNLSNLAGGMSAWKAAGMKFESVPASQRSIDRQAHFFAGTLIVLAFVLSGAVSPGWIYLAALPGFGLLLDAITGVCPVSLLLKRAPWNA